MDHAMNAIMMASAAALILLGFVPARAQTFEGINCENVRHLSTAEQNYWSARLKLSADQRHRIYVACYQNHADARHRDRASAANVVR